MILSLKSQPIPAQKVQTKLLGRWHKTTKIYVPKANVRLELHSEPTKVWRSLY